MIYVSVAIYDSGLEAFGRPAFVRSRGEAVRSFGDEVNRKGTDREPSQINAHPEDFALFYIGEFDDETGHYKIPDRPQKLADAHTMLKKD